jgi:MFS family permease
MRSREAQIALLTIIVFFVGGMVGLERTVVPLMGVRLFGLASASAAFSFVVSFGLTKAVMNLFVGRLADLWGRRHLLLAGFAIGIPIPLLLMNASNWNGIIIANFLLGIMQSLTWSMTVLMGVDHAGSRARGLVVGLNEFAGYAGLSLVAFTTGVIAEWTHLRPQPFYLGIGLVIIGISLSFFAEETRILAHTETKIRQEDASASFGTVILRTTLRHPSLSAASLGGLATNLKDGMMWGLLPLFLHARHLNLIAIGTVVAVYPAVWASGQLLFGPLSDHVGRKALIVSGLTLQGLALLVFLWAVSFWEWLIAAVLLGVGTAMVYPTLIALVSDMAAPTWRASALGVYRCWRDLGYAVGAIIAGFISDTIGIPAALLITALLMGVVAIQAGMRIRSPAQRPATLG